MKIITAVADILHKAELVSFVRDGYVSEWRVVKSYCVAVEKLQRDFFVEFGVRECIPA